MTAASQPVELEGVRLLFHTDWWDGPLTGLAEYQGREYFFDAVWDEAADDRTYPRRLLLRTITDAEIAEEWRVHRPFEHLVGTHCCAHDGVTERVMRSQSDQKKFFEMFPPTGEKPYADRPVIGAFTVTKRRSRIPGSEPT